MFCSCYSQKYRIPFFYKNCMLNALLSLSPNFQLCFLLLILQYTWGFFKYFIHIHLLLHPCFLEFVSEFTFVRIIRGQSRNNKANGQALFCWVLGLGCFFETPFKAARYWTWSGGRGGRGGFVTILYYHFMRGGSQTLGYHFTHIGINWGGN